jgi:hypothetical protein
MGNPERDPPGAAAVTRRCVPCGEPTEATDAAGFEGQARGLLGMSGHPRAATVLSHQRPLMRGLYGPLIGVDENLTLAAYLPFAAPALVVYSV